MINLHIFLDNIGQRDVINVQKNLIFINCFLQPLPCFNYFCRVNRCFISVSAFCVVVKGPHKTTRIRPLVPPSVSCIRFPTLSDGRFLKNVCHPLMCWWQPPKNIQLWQLMRARLIKDSSTLLRLLSSIEWNQSLERGIGWCTRCLFWVTFPVTSKDGSLVCHWRVGESAS